MSANVLNVLAPALLVSAPARAHSVRPADEDRLDPADLVALDLEQLAQLPGPVDVAVVEGGEREHDPALTVDRDEAAVADARYHVPQRRLVLALAGHHRIAAHADRARRPRADHAVLVPQAVVGERVVALAVVALHPLEVLIG